MEIGDHDRGKRCATSEAHKVLDKATPGTRRSSKICFHQPLHALLRRGPLLADGGSMSTTVGKHRTIAHLLESIPAVRRRFVRLASSIRRSVRAQMSGEYEPAALMSTTGGMPIFASRLPEADSPGRASVAPRPICDVR